MIIVIVKIIVIVPIRMLINNHCANCPGGLRRLRLLQRRNNWKAWSLWPGFNMKIIMTLYDFFTFHFPFSQCLLFIFTFHFHLFNWKAWSRLWLWTFWWGQIRMCFLFQTTDDDILSFSLMDSVPVNPLWVEILMQEGSFSNSSDPNPFLFLRVFDAKKVPLFVLTFPQTDLSWTI